MVLLACVHTPLASAHAVLQTTEPADDAILGEAPAAVTLRFDEPIEASFGALRVYDTEAHRVDTGEIERPSADTVAVGLDESLADGTYTVTWRVVSADSHPISGAYVFHVGAPGARPGGIASEVLGAGTPSNVAMLFTGIRAVDFALLLLVVGGTAMLAFVLESADGRTRRRLWTVLAALAGALVLVSLAGIVLQGASAGGFGLAEALDRRVISAVLETQFGRAWLVQAGLAAALGLLAFALSRRERKGRLADLALVPACALVLVPAAAGHASVNGVLAFVTDVAHVEVAATWAGGLAFLVLAIVIAGEDRWPLISRAVPRFSTLALVSVAVLIATGLVTAYLQVRAWRGLWETDYGVLLLVKVGLVLVIVGLGAYHNRRVVPRLREGIGSLAVRRRFLRTTAVELGLLTAVVGVTAVLVSQPPARAEVVPAGPFATTAELGDLELNLVVDPAQAGSNQFHVYLTDRAGQTASVDEVTISARLPSREIGPLHFASRTAGPGHSIASGVLAIAGDWQVTVAARRGEFELLRRTVSVPIRKDT
jgi:copper transport protein